MALDATNISVREVLTKFDTEFASVAQAAENGEFALWVGSGISRQAPNLGDLIERAFEFLRQKAIDPPTQAAFTRSLDEAVTLAGLDPAKLQPQYTTLFASWADKSQIVKALWDQYSDLLDIRIVGERGDRTLNEEGEVIDRGRSRTSPKGVEKWFIDVPPARVAMEAGTHSIWISEHLQELGHEVIVANVRELRAISHSDRKSDQVDAEKLARYARLDPKILRPISHRTVAQQEALTLIRARNVIVRLRTAAVNAVRGLAKPCGYRLPASSTLCFAKRCMAVLPPGLAQALGPVLEQIATMTDQAL